MIEQRRHAWLIALLAVVLEALQPMSLMGALPMSEAEDVQFQANQLKFYCHSLDSVLFNEGLKHFKI